MADPYAESALESISKLRLAAAGLPMPEPQREVFSSDGRFLGRLDFYWDEFDVAGEADGSGKLALDPDGLPMVAEKRRQGLLEDAGLIFVRWGWPDLRTFARTAGELRAAFARGQRPDRAPRRYRIGGWPYRSAAG